MNLLQVLMCWSCSFLLAKTSLIRSKRESEQRPMKLSWIPVVEPSELKNAQSLMIDIHPFNLEKSTKNIPRFKPAKEQTNFEHQQQTEHINRQRGRNFNNQKNRKIPQKQIEEEEEDEDQQQQQQFYPDPRYTSVKPFIPGQIPLTKSKQKLLNRANIDGTKSRSVNRPVTKSRHNHKNIQADVSQEDDDEEEEDFQPRSQTTHKHHQPVVEDEDENVNFRVDNQHPFQGKEQRMPGERNGRQGKHRKTINRPRVNKFQQQQQQQHDDEDEDEDEEGTEEVYPKNYPPVYMVDDPKQDGSTRQQEDDENEEDEREEDGTDNHNGPLEEFDGYYDVAPEKKKGEQYDESRYNHGNDKDGFERIKAEIMERKRAEKERLKKAKRGGVTSSSSRKQQQQQKRHHDDEEDDDDSGFAEPFDPRSASKLIKSIFNPHTSSQLGASKGGKGKLQVESSNNFVTKLKKIEHEGYGIGIGYLSDI